MKLALGQETKVKLLPSLTEQTEEGISVSHSDLSVEIFWNTLTQRNMTALLNSVHPFYFQ